MIGNEKKAWEFFGQRNRVAVRLLRIDGWWHAHSSLLPRPERNLRTARQKIRRKLMSLSKGGE